MVTTQLLGRDYFTSGDTLDEFTLLEVVGGGGEGGVWSAWDSFHKRLVALKFFQLDETTRSIDKRREELLALARIEHPNIRKNARVMSETLIPKGPFMSVSLTDQRALGQELSQLLGMTSMGVGMMSMAIPDPEVRPVISKITSNSCPFRAR